VAIALVAVAAVPATEGEPWRSWRMKQLFLGVVIGAGIAALHELLVLSSVHQVLRHREANPHVGDQGILIYALSLTIAVFFEPITRILDRAVEYVAHRRAPPVGLLEEALHDIRTSRRRLDRAIARATRWGERFPADSPRRTGWVTSDSTSELYQREVRKTIIDIREESRQAAVLLDQIESDLGALQAVDSETPPAGPNP
jgi:hypothetical protein